MLGKARVRLLDFVALRVSHVTKGGVGFKVFDILYPDGYRYFMNTFFRTDVFAKWLNGLKDAGGKARILVRIRSAEAGNFGDCEPVGEGVSEMRIHAGPGYRVYFTRRGETIYLLLAGGDKCSQKRDIVLAKKLARELEDSHD